MFSLLAQAGNIDLGAPSGFSNLVNFEIGSIISSAVALVLIIAAVVFFFMLVIGGIRWITSGGDKGQTEAARGQITAALVGLVIVFAAYAIVSIIEAFFGVNILSFDLDEVFNTN
jgi:hypothetical protein